MTSRLLKRRRRAGFALDNLGASPKSDTNWFMANAPLRVLYLTNALPPGVSGRFPSLGAAAHATETRMAQALAKRVTLSTVGLLSRRVWGHLELIRK
jgi:hypothetical protein